MVERQEGVGHALALLDPHAFTEGRCAPVHLEPLGDVVGHHRGVLLESLGLGGGVAALEGGGSVLEERVLLGGVRGRDDEQVVLEAEFGGDVVLLGCGGVDVHHGREAVGLSRGRTENDPRGDDDPEDGGAERAAGHGTPYGWREQLPVPGE